MFCTIFFLLSCAQIVPLTGGDKDVDAPKEVESLPKNGSVNFTEKEITIEFDEFIQLQNLQTQLIVSPLMKEKPDVTVKGKKLVIKLPDSLLTNTTYSLNFGEAIVDITENNPIPNYKYVFSTGSYLDSLSYSGTVANSIDLKPKEKFFVLLYDQFEDSIPYKGLPRYVAITDKEGKFTISNIANGQYKVFAINDINSNYLFDLPNEEIAFLDETIDLNRNVEGVLLYTFEEDNAQQFLVKSKNDVYSKISVILNEPTSELAIKPVEVEFEGLWNLIEKNKTGDTINVWLTQKLDIDNLKLEISDNAEVIDTASITLIKDKKFEETKLSLSTNISKTFDLNQSVIITTGRPTKTFDLKNIKLLQDSVEVVYTISNLDSVNRKFVLNYSFKESTSYQLFIPSNTFTDYFELSNDTLISAFTTKSKSDYGTIALTVSPNFSDNYIVQLYKNQQLVKEVFQSGEKKILFEYLQPGNYELKMIIDNDNNQKWTTGLYIENRQPEKVIYYEKPIVLKANWDNDINWIINE